MRLVGAQKLAELQQNTENIRNICILAHVDHGKTTLADSLVASNGIISQKMAGKLRYMDSRKDEQERGITMKSSSIALFYSSEGKEYLINLIDSPGHVDFSSEVSTAVRLCDGAVVVVDVVEGVCPQTQVALKQAWLENIKPILVLNKIDRLILEMKLSPLDAYVHLTQVLEQVNAILGELFTTEVLGKEVISGKSSDGIDGLSDVQKDISQWATGLEDADDSQLYFSPDHGNVVFASAVDGWGFSVPDFAHLIATKLGMNESVLKQFLWGDYYFHAKSKKILPGAQEKAKKPLFVQFVLENLWAVYETIVIRKDKEKLQKILDSLQIKITTRDMRHTDSKVQLQAVFMQWLPIATSVLDMICSKLPSPLEITGEKVEKLMCSQTQRFDSLPGETQALKSSFLQCSCSDDAPTIVFISKMFPVERKLLPQNRSQPLSAEEIAMRRVQARQRHAEKLMQECSLEDTNSIQNSAGEEISSLPSQQVEDTPPAFDSEEDVFIAFARVFSGTLKKGQEVYVLGPKHDPHIALEMLRNGETIPSNMKLKDLKAGQHITKVNVEHLYLLMGRELEAIESVPAGNVLGIGGLEEHVLKTATLATTVACPAFTELPLLVVPILRVAVEPCQPQDLQALIQGLRLLNQADACVQVIVQETGEHVLVTAGEVHLQRCLDDLKERYAKIPINASEPIVPFRETIVDPPTVDMVNETISDQNTAKKGDTSKNEDNLRGLITIHTSNKQCEIKIRATPLPQEVTKLLENNMQLLKAMDGHSNFEVSKDLESVNTQPEETVNRAALTERTLKAINDLKNALEKAFINAGEEWEGAVNKIWSVGPRRCGPNVLLNKIPGYNRGSIWEMSNSEKVMDRRTDHDSSFIYGFQLATLAGPLCEEPMMGVCFIVEDWTVLEISETGESFGNLPFGPFSGQIMSAVKEGCRRAFQAQPQRLMAAMYSCNIQANAEVLGKMYAVLARRHGRVLHGDVVEGSASFSVTAVLPVVESFSFAPEMRKQTSGLASPQLVFSHWEVIEIDPFWTPATEEEYLHFGEKADAANRARKYMDSVRKRKGLTVEEKIVEFAQKQRTLKKKK